MVEHMVEHMGESCNEFTKIASPQFTLGDILASKQVFVCRTSDLANSSGQQSWMSRDWSVGRCGQTARGVGGRGRVMGTYWIDVDV